MNEYNPIDINQRATQQSRKSSHITMSPVLWGLLVVFLIILLATVYLTYTVVHDATAARNNLTTPEAFSLTESALLNQPGVNINAPLQPENGPTPIPWDGANRVTILLMGLGGCPGCEPGAATQSDTLMLLTMDPVSRTAGILSIPRDLWVNVPGFDYGKIATANFIGEIYDLPGGGPGLAIQTVEQLLGIDINYYAVVDFSAFEEFINEIGGIDVDVPYEQTVDPIGPGNTVTLPQGIQHLDGPTALAYARNRETAGNDYDRIGRQQQVVMAVRDQVLSLGTLPKLIASAPTIYNNLRNGIHSNLTLKEAISLAWTAAQIPQENIKRSLIGPNEVTDSWSADGQRISLPNLEAIRVVRDEVFSTTSGVAPAATVYVSNPEELRQEENATVSVLNATTTAGLASQTTNYLLDQGINVTETGNAQDKSDSTVIIDYTGKPYTVKYLVDLLGIEPNSIYSRYDPNSQVDIAILLGTDWAENNTMP
jgi:LCP family protein required for cell wall assembly